MHFNHKTGHSLLLCFLASLLLGACATTGVREGAYHTKELGRELARPSKFDVPIVINERVLAWIDYYQSAAHDRFASYLARSGKYIPMMREVFKKYALPQDLVYIAMIESGFKTNAYSRSHAVGPWQFIRGTGRRYGLEVNYWVDERRDPLASTVAAARHLRDLFDEFGDWYLAFAAYNAGEGKIKEALRRTGARDFWEVVERDRRYLKVETKDYVPKFIAAAIIAKSPNRFGFGDVVYEHPLSVETAEAASQTDFDVIARCAGIPPADVAELNPHLIRGTSPPGKANYKIVLPRGTAEQFTIAYANVPPSERVMVARHKLRRGETLTKVARRYGVSVRALLAANDLANAGKAKAGMTLVIPLGGSAKKRAESAALSAPAVKRPRHKVKQEIARKIEPPPSGGNLSERIDVDSIEAHPLIASSDLLAVGGEKEVREYTVQHGDTVWDIANRFGISAKEIINLNNLSKRARIWPGDVIRVR